MQLRQKVHKGNGGSVLFDGSSSTKPIVLSSLMLLFIHELTSQILLLLVEPLYKFSISMMFN